jgi:flagellar basal body-associated protein FliL
MKTFFILLLLIIIIAGGYIGSVLLIKDMRGSRAETMTQKYVANLYKEYSIVGINCQGEDTDGDSYVSCDVRLRIGDDRNTDTVRYLSCPTMWKSFTGSTCKERQIIPQGN